MSGGKTVAELAEIARGKLLRGSGSIRVTRVAPTDSATRDSITFLTNPKYIPFLKNTEAAAVLISPILIDEIELPEHIAIIATPSPYAAFARVAQALLDRVPQPEGVHPSAVIDPTAMIGNSVSIGPFVYIGPGASILDGA